MHSPVESPGDSPFDIDAPFTPDYKQAREVYRQRMPSGLSVFTECKGLVKLGRRPMLYLIWIQFTVLFLFLISCVEIAHIKFFYDNPTTSNIFYRLSMANWNPNNSSAASITLAVLEGILLILVVAYIRGYSAIRNRIVRLATESMLSISDFTVHVRNVPSQEVKYGTARLNQFFRQFGPVHAVKMSIDSGDMGKMQKKQRKLTKQVHHMAVKATRACLLFPYYRIRYWIASLHLRYINWKIAKKEAKSEYKCTGDAFVTFDCEKSRFKCLHLYNRPYLTRCCQTVKFGTKSEKKTIFRVDNSKEPSDILWENLEFSRLSKILRRSAALIVTAIAMAATIVSSYYLAVYQYSLQSVNLDNIQNVLTDAQLVGQAGQNIGISIVLVIINYIMTFVMFYLSGFEKHRFRSHKYVSQLYKLAIALTLTSIFVMGPYMTKATDVNGKISFASWNAPPYVELTQFYFSLFVMFCTAVAFNAGGQIIQWPWQWVQRWFRAFNSISQEELNTAYIPPKYHYAYRYAYQLKLVMLGIAFSGLFPLGLFVMTIGLAISYPIEKFNLIKVYAKVGKDDDFLSNTAVACIALSWLIRYILMAVRIYYFASVNPPLQITNPFLISYIACFALFGAFLIFQYILVGGTNVFVNLFCCSRFRFPHYITGNKGTVSINTYPQLKQYHPPVNIDKLIYEKRKTMALQEMQSPLTPNV